MPLPPYILSDPVPVAVRDLWHRIRHWRSFAFLALGGLWDVLTLARIDRWSDQAFITTYQVVFAGALILDLRWRATERGPWWLHRFPNALRYLSQLALGSLLSAYCVYYFRGAAGTRAVAYAVLLLGLLIANEYVTDKVNGVGARLAVFAFALFNGLIFALPLWLGWLVPPWAAAVCALGLTVGAYSLATPGPLRKRVQSAPRGLLPAAGVLAAVLGLVWMDVLPPLPLSLQRVGVYRGLTPGSDGIELTWETSEGLIAWRYDRVLHWMPDETVSCFSAVFAPRGMEMEIAHSWERLDPAAGWVVVDHLILPVVGGRGAGFRTYSRKRNLEPGKWRVRILSPGDRALGRVRFDVVAGRPTQPLRTIIY